VRAHLSRGDVERLLPEAVAGEDVDDAHDGDEDAGGDDEAPVGVAEGFFRGRDFVEVAEDADAEDGH